MTSDFASATRYSTRVCIRPHRVTRMRAAQYHWVFNFGDAVAALQCVRNANRQGYDHLRRVGMSSGRKDGASAQRRPVRHEPDIASTTRS